MNKKQFPYLNIFVSIITIAIIAIQVYWNWKSYEDTKKRLVSDIQVTVDNTVDKYFIDISRKNLRDLFPAEFAKAIPVHYDEYDTIDNNYKNNIANTQIEQVIPEYITAKRKKVRGAIILNNMQQSKQYGNDSLKTFTIRIDSVTQQKKANKNNNVNIDRLEIKNNNQQRPIIIEAKPGESIQLFGDSIDFKKLNLLLNKTLTKKGLSIDFDLVHTKLKEVVYAYNNLTKKEITKTYIPLKYNNSITVKSDYLFFNQEMKLHFKNLNFIAFKKTLNSILLSLVLSIGMIWCMFFLIRTINKQKQIAEMKNDFISNISHELKTPIAIVSSAIEGIEKFNVENDIEKTKKYLSISNQELGKLNTMVEKILETATLETNQLQLKKEKTNLFNLIEKCIEKAQISTQKRIVFNSENKNTFTTIDVFHFENAISNMIENANKYGGDQIDITIKAKEANIEIEISDNGAGIPKAHQKKIFDKFYRIPTKNLHDVKGFGIGLYYVKQIIEKHHGKIELISETNSTNFKISLPNE
jgi:signal transduction histidine kinase